MCEEKFHTERSLNRHRKGHHRTNIFNSNLCEKEVVDKSKFKEHESVDQNQVTVACSICKKGFNTEINLKEHMEEITCSRRLYVIIVKTFFMMRLI